MRRSTATTEWMYLGGVILLVIMMLFIYYGLDQFVSIRADKGAPPAQWYLYMHHADARTADGPYGPYPNQAQCLREGGKLAMWALNRGISVEPECTRTIKRGNR